MSPQLQILPDELLVQLLGCLPKSDLKSARLTCPRFGRIGAQWLIQPVYFAPRQSAMDTFLNISVNPVFARTVTELVYDGRLFRDEFTTYRSYKEVFDEWTPDEYTGDIDDDDDDEQAAQYIGRQIASVSWELPGAHAYHECLADSLARYTRLLDQQQRILEDKKDHEALCAGLKSLPNIATVIVLDNFHECCDWRSQHEIGVPVGPSSWARDNSREKWDVRGIQHLIGAVADLGHNVRELHIASERSPAPMSILVMDQDAWDKGRRMVQHLELLKLDLYTEYKSEDEAREQEDRLNLFLSEAKTLRCLAITGRQEVKLLKNKVWPHLETLNLGDIALCADDLKVYTQTHKGTLRNLTFRNVNIVGDEGWEDVAKGIGKYLRLLYVSILGVSDDVTNEDTESPYIEDDISLEVARSFMQSVPRTTCSLVTLGSVTVVASPEENASGTLGGQYSAPSPIPTSSHP